MTPNAQVEKMKKMSPGAAAWLLGAQNIHPGDPQTDADIAILSHLHPSAMANLLELSPRAFRDRVDLPRNEDGTFNARDVTRAMRDDADKHFMTRLVRDGHYGAVVGLDSITTLFAGPAAAVDGLPERPSRARVISTIGAYLSEFFGSQPDETTDDA